MIHFGLTEEMRTLSMKAGVREAAGLATIGLQGTDLKQFLDVGRVRRLLEGRQQMRESVLQLYLLIQQDNIGL